MEFEIKHRWTKAVLFTAEIECTEGASFSVNLGLAVRKAVEARANLWDADLRGANLWGASGVNDHVKCIQIDQYPITYTHDILQIGCERHPIADWADFDDARIAQMDGKAAQKFWRKYKDWIFSTIEMCPAKATNEEAA